jgi:hypothetical protein
VSAHDGATGNLIHHAAARAVRPLAIPMVQPPFRTLLMAASGGPEGRVARAEWVLLGRLAGAHEIAQGLLRGVGHPPGVKSPAR